MIIADFGFEFRNHKSEIRNYLIKQPLNLHFNNFFAQDRLLTGPSYQ